jgi:hypothetical protein
VDFDDRDSRGETFADRTVADEGAPDLCEGCSVEGCSGRGYGCRWEERWSDEIEVALV